MKTQRVKKNPLRIVPVRIFTNVGTERPVIVA
jgi:hypothetical protein